MSNMIISLHIPKTAGTSLMTSLQYVYGKRVLNHNKDPNLTYNSSFATISQSYDLVHGHINLDRASHLTERASLIFTFLRDPVERVVSSYYYHRQLDKVTNMASKQINENDLSLQGFAELPSQRNLQHRMIWPVSKQKVEFYGFVETYQTSLEQLSRLLSVKLAVDTQNVNVNAKKTSSSRYAIPDDLRSYIASLNSKDFELYKWAFKRSMDKSDT